MSSTVRTSTCLFVSCLVASVLPMQANALEGSWQVGINGGVSRLAPETDGSAFTLDDEQSTAVGAYFGLDVHPIVSAEIAFTQLGEATLSQDQTIGYQAISLGATAYVFGETEADRRSDGLSGFVRLGVSAIENEADIELSEADNVSIWAGAGIQLPMGDHWGFRAELASYDGDAQALLAGVYWRAGGGVGGRTRGISSAPVFQPEPKPPAPEPVTTPQPVQEPAPPAQPEAPAPIIAEQPKVAEAAVDCPPEAARRISDTASCALLNSAVDGLLFAGSGAAIQPGSESSLNAVATALQQNPSIVIEIRAHVQSMGDEQAEARLAAERAKSVARYLVQSGVPVAQLRAKAFGATQPLLDGASPEARQANNRIELRTL